MSSRYEFENVRAMSVNIESSPGGFPRLVIEYAVLPGGDELLSTAGMEGIRRMAEAGFNWGFVPKSKAKDGSGGAE